MSAFSTIDHGAEILTRTIQPAEGNLGFLGGPFSLQR